MHKLLSAVLITITLLVGALYYLLHDACRNSPECACKNAQPGDVTCLSPIQLSEWCLKQKNRSELHQCNLITISRATKEAIIQSILDHKLLQSYLRPSSPGRNPLILSDHIIGSDLSLLKFGQKVVFVQEKSVKTPFLRFTLFDCNQGNYCNISFEYSVEGVTGSTGVWIGDDGSHYLEKTDISEI